MHGDQDPDVNWRSLTVPDSRLEAEVILPTELSAVADAAGEHLRAETDEEEAAIARAAEALLTAATSAMAAGYTLSQIAQADARGKDDVRRSLGGEGLERVQRTGRRARQTKEEHHQAIARAMRLGLSTREIAAAAEVTHGTIRSINSRVIAGKRSADLESEQSEEQEFDA